ncbi:hypothetical protein [Clostridium cellulovorans]|uniref:Uncharacterized protein n=1 Tax=Clostridium cellulovorans (strain ATCC 35296 / DSM 3052 / OCM 3 / 743B) TaxID=573061 RepID=D9SKX3_CLOC7|nr:hypothetical protein [Clostridium cellulovorans]ADL53545.1 hypothetical protein Clocel_3879 [Clostridium cellulovorans 743B]
MEDSQFIACKKHLESMKTSNMDLDDIYKLINYMYLNEYSKDMIKKVLTNVFGHSFPNSLTTIAHILVSEKDYNLAMDYINLALKTIKKDELYFLRSFCEYKLGDYHKCLKTIEKLDPEEYGDVIKELGHLSNDNLNINVI